MITRQEAKLRAKSKINVTNVLNFLAPTIASILVVSILTAIVSIVLGLVFGIASIPFISSDGEGGLIVGILSLISTLISSAISLVIYAVEAVVVQRAAYKVITSDTDLNIGEVFSFSFNVKPHISTAIMYSLVTGIGMVLCVIPGIIAGVIFYPSMIISIMKPENNWKQNFAESKKFMSSYWSEFVMLYLSFIGWAILGIICCCIPYFIYVAPWIAFAVTLFVVLNYSGTNGNGPQTQGTNNSYNTGVVYTDEYSNNSNVSSFVGMGNENINEPVNAFEQSQEVTSPFDNGFAEVSSEDSFKQAINNMVEIEITFLDSNGNQRDTVCRPMDIVEADDKSKTQYQMYGRTSTGEMKPLTLTEEKIIKVRVTTNRFNPAEHVTWTPRWRFARNWGNLS